MGYSQHYAESAGRHFQAAELLYVGPRRDVAGYLYGIAAECAVKAMMREFGMRPLPEAQRRDDAFFAHFPALKTLLSQHAQGRRAGELRKLASNGAFMSNWDTDMRYTRKEDVTDKQVGKWKTDADRALRAMKGW
jgi:hypothetical protein